MFLLTRLLAEPQQNRILWRHFLDLFIMLIKMEAPCLLIVLHTNTQDSCFSGGFSAAPHKICAHGMLQVDFCDIEVDYSEFNLAAFCKIPHLYLVCYLLVYRYEYEHHCCGIPILHGLGTEKDLTKFKLKK